MHIKSGAGGGQVSAAGNLRLNRQRLGVDGRDIGTARVPFTEPWDVGCKCTVREASITVRGLRGMAWEAIARGTARATTNWSGEVLHPGEEMRRDKGVPTNLRKYRRFDGLSVPGERHESRPKRKEGAEDVQR